MKEQGESLYWKAWRPGKFVVVVWKTAPRARPSAFYPIFSHDFHRVVASDIQHSFRLMSVHIVLHPFSYLHPTRCALEKSGVLRGWVGVLDSDYLGAYQTQFLVFERKSVHKTVSDIVCYSDVFWVHVTDQSQIIRGLIRLSPCRVDWSAAGKVDCHPSIGRHTLSMHKSPRLLYKGLSDLNRWRAASSNL